jgi:hypothetical protein
MTMILYRMRLKADWTAHTRAPVAPNCADNSLVKRGFSVPSSRYGNRNILTWAFKGVRRLPRRPGGSWPDQKRNQEGQKYADRDSDNMPRQAGSLG